MYKVKRLTNLGLAWASLLINGLSIFSSTTMRGLYCQSTVSYFPGMEGDGFLASFSLAAFSGKASNPLRTGDRTGRYR
ncbi:hypothetical protein B0T22DRAFT_101724 [Podospora appendiculata]|uniref:Uncharacterized protein n=1 Tax=Podospora appendiculata TaxID=314037 RepID=A0AAE1CI25_9PEZI|nr:hypothetical protein B0T22DRAFT_101724 [Podospora appendiculata]